MAAEAKVGTVAAAALCPLLIVVLTISTHWCWYRRRGSSTCEDFGPSEDVWVVEVHGDDCASLTIQIVDRWRGTLVSCVEDIRSEGGVSLLGDGGFFAHELAACVELAVRRSGVISDPAAVMLVANRALGDVSASECVSGLAKARGLVVDCNNGTGDGSVRNIAVVHRTLALCAACAQLQSQPVFPQPKVRFLSGDQEDTRSHVLLQLSASASRAVVFVCREKPRGVPVLQLMARQLSCGAKPWSGSEALATYQRVELEPLVDQVMKYVADLGLPSPTVAAVGPGSDDPLIRRVMDAKGLAMWLPGPSCNDIGLVAYGAACLAPGKLEGRLLHSISVRSAQSVIPSFDDVLHALRTQKALAAADEKQVNTELSRRSSFVSISTASDSTPWGSFRRLTGSRPRSVSLHVTPREMTKEVM